MIVREREPLVYYTPAPSNEWSGAAIVLASALVVLLFIMLYWFAALHAVNIDNMPAPSSVIEQPIPTPTAVPQPILIPTPSLMPRATVPSPRSLVKPVPASAVHRSSVVHRAGKAPTEEATPGNSVVEPIPAGVVHRVGE